MNLYRKLFKWYRKRLRRIDREILFKSINELAPDKDVADRAILKHIMTDPAWDYPKEWVEEGINGNAPN